MPDTIAAETITAPKKNPALGRVWFWCQSSCLRSGERIPISCSPFRTCAIAPGRTICLAAIPSQPLHRRNAPERRRRHLAVSIAQCNLCTFRASSDLYPLNVRQCIARNDSCFALPSALCSAACDSPPSSLPRQPLWRQLRLPRIFPHRWPRASASGRSRYG